MKKTYNMNNENQCLRCIHKGICILQQNYRKFYDEIIEKQKLKENEQFMAEIKCLQYIEEKISKE